MCMASGTSQKTTCLTDSTLKNGITKVQHDTIPRHTVSKSESFSSAGATIPPVNGKTWDFLCPTGNAPAGAPCPTALTGDLSFFICFFSLPKMFTFEDRGVLMENRLIGLPRLRQLKVTNSSCNIPKDFRGIIRRCYSRLANASILLFIFAFYIQVHSGRGRQAGFWAGR